MCSTRLTLELIQSVIGREAMTISTKTLNTKTRNNAPKKSVVVGLTLAVSAALVALNNSWLETDSDEATLLQSNVKEVGHNLKDQNLLGYSQEKESNDLIGLPDVEGVFESTSPSSAYYGVISVEEYEALTALGPLPKAIQGITLPTLSYDQHGNLIATENLMKLIEHFLSVAQQDGRDRAISRIEEYVGLALPVDAANQAYAIVQNYLDYKAAVPDLHIPVDALDVKDKIAAMHESFDHRKQLRREHLGDEVADAFFANEEAYKEYSFSRIELRASSDLSEAERRTIILNAEAKLPEEMRQRVSQKRQEAEFKVQISALQKQGGKQQEIYHLREAHYGEDAAKKLAYFEDRSESWMARVNQFNTERNRVRGDSSLSEGEKENTIKQMKSNEFSNKEIFKLAYQNIKQRNYPVN